MREQQIQRQNEHTTLHGELTMHLDGMGHQHFQVGILHYFAVITGFISELPGFAFNPTSREDQSSMQLANVTPYQWFATGLYFWSALQHHKSVE